MNAYTAIAQLAMDHAGTAAKQLDCTNIAELTKKASLPGDFKIPGPDKFLNWHGYTLLGILDVLCVHTEASSKTSNGSDIGATKEIYDVLVRHIPSGTVVSIKPDGNDYTKITAQPATEYELKMFKTFFQQDEPIDNTKLPDNPAKWLAFYRAKLLRNQKIV
jgi:hypothetical protein